MLKYNEEKEKSGKKVWKWGEKKSNEQGRKATRKERVRGEQKWGEKGRNEYRLLVFINSQNILSQLFCAMNEKKKLWKKITWKNSLNKEKKKRLRKSEKKTGEIHTFFCIVHFLLFFFCKTPLAAAILFCWCSWRKIFANKKRGSDFKTKQSSRGERKTKKKVGKYPLTHTHGGGFFFFKWDFYEQKESSISKKTTQYFFFFFT